MKKFLAVLSLICMILMSVACDSSIGNVDEVVTKLEVCGYQVDYDFNDYGNMLIGSSVEDKLLDDYQGLIAHRTSTSDTVYAIYFYEIKDARTYYDDMKESMYDYDFLFSDLKIKKKGRWVMIGTEAALDDILRNESCM